MDTLEVFTVKLQVNAGSLINADVLKQHMVLLKPVHTGDYSRRFRRQFVAEKCDCRRKMRLSQRSATVAEFGDCRRFLAVFGDTRRFLRQCGQGFSKFFCGIVSSNSK